ncbi:endo alpha-1,4 polygalactosaminidase [Streptomyces boninensis]|uniref:endo alpha-1,4 polygalactosaminidase n=1 Tax=Streptomyces boninensis TaxID=2039455 RepID=UPI003B2287D0
MRRIPVALLLLLLALTACSPGDAGPGVRLPQPGAVFDYQLGGPYQPEKQVEAVARDRTAKPAPGRYNICYVNAFQTQPGRSIAWWQKHHDDLLLRRGGEMVIDEDWGEALLDISTADKRDDLLQVVGPWLDGCARDGYDAVEPDNLDSYTRSDGLLKAKDAVAFARLLAVRAHEKGLAIGQKNTADLLPRSGRIGFDFAVVEECAAYDECGPFIKAYDGRVFAVEYQPAAFERGCRRWGEELSLTLRDLDVRQRGAAGYVFRTC